MIPLLTAAEMRALEQEAIASGRAASLELQERAAAGAAALLPDGVPIEVLAGPGNNGGDALAVARMLKGRGQQVRVWALSPDPKWKGDAAIQAQRWREMGGEVAFTEQPASVVEAWDARWVVDGLFGLGASRPLDGLAARWAWALNAPRMAHLGLGESQAREEPTPEYWNRQPRGLQVLALDLPSGLDPSHGDKVGPVIRADVTAVFAFLKLCHGLLPSETWCGRLETVDLGLVAAPQMLQGSWQLGVPRWSPAPWDAHKRRMGHLVIRAGRKGMSGAAVLAALGALRVGTGLVTVLTDPDVRAEIAAQVPEAMVNDWTGELPEGADALLVGPGGVQDIPTWSGPLILDASALQEGQGPRWMARPNTILTPHPGEFARLFGLSKAESSRDRLAQLRQVATGPGVIALKGPRTLVAGGRSEELWINPTGHAGLATGGTGDFLAGMIAGIRAQQRIGMFDTMHALQGLDGEQPDLPPNLAEGRHPRNAMNREAAAAGVYLHGWCADRLGVGPLLPRDLAAELPRLLRELCRV